MCDSCEFEMRFGKYQGETLDVIRLADKDYLYWLSKNISDDDVLEAIDEVLEEHGR